jgi:hypothetical protein
MRYVTRLLAVSWLACGVVLGQDSVPSTTANNGPAAAPQSYVVQLTEFRLKESSDPSLSAGDIVRSFQQMKDDENLELVETVRLSTLAHHESMVQFGKQATVITGVAFPGAGRAPARSTQQQTIGTLVRVTVEPRDGKVLLKLSYEVSRFEGELPEDRPPHTVTKQFNTTLLIEAGKPTLVAGTSADATSYLIVSIEE